MFCEKCGSNIAEGELFCGNCGAPVTQPQSFAPQFDDQPQSSAPQLDEQPRQFAPQFDDEQQGFAPQFDEQADKTKNGKKRMNKKLKIALIAGGVVLLAGLIVLLVILLTRKPSMAELEKNSFHESLEAFASDGLIDNGTYSVRLEPGQYLSDLAENEGIDISWIKDVDMDFIVDSDNDRAGYGARFALNGTEIGAISALLDIASNELKVEMDGLSDYVGVMDLSEAGISSLGAASKIDKDKMIKLIEKYYDMVFDSIDNVKESNGEFTANGVSEKCRILTADISQRKLFEIANKVLNEALNDNDLKDFVISMYNAGGYSAYYSADEFYADMQNSIRSAIDSSSAASKNASETTMITLVDYVSDKKIIGRNITFYSMDGSRMGDVTFGNAHNGDKFGTVLSVNGKTYILGSGTQNGDSLNGDIVVYGEDGELAAIKLDNYDFEKNEGSIEVSLSKSAWQMITRDSSLASTLSICSVRIDKSGDTASFDVLAGKERIIKATLSKRAPQTVQIDGSKSEKDMSSWSETISFETIYDRLVEAGVPERMLNSLLSSVSSASGSFDDDYHF